MRINEKNFLRELKKQNEQALEYVIDHYGNLVYSIVKNVLKTLENQSVVEEVVSDVFFSLWNNIESFRGDEKNFKNWLGAISKYKSIDCYRKIKKEKNLFISVDENMIKGQWLEEEIIRDIETRDVIKIISNLGEPEKSIMIMKFFYGYNTRKISQLLKMSISNIDTKVSRARKKIREKYNEEKGDVLSER